MSWMFPRRSGIRAPETREWILGALYLPVFLFFLNFAILTYFPALGFPLTEPRNYFFANLLYMTVNFAVMLLIFRRTLWQSLREFEGKMLLSVLIGFGMCYGANLVLTTAYTVLDIMPENYNQEAVNSLLGGYPLAMTLCTVVLAPLAEECLFRGVLFAPLARKCLRPLRTGRARPSSLWPCTGKGATVAGNLPVAAGAHLALTLAAQAARPVRTASVGFWLRPGQSSASRFRPWPFRMP